ncbi:MAG: IS66 family transposase [Phycisphaerales bacterium]|nr:IS66 family transposase [Phycisphaerales bacterium]
MASRNRDLDERVRQLEALLKAEQDRAAHEREQREALAEKHSFAERLLAELKKNYTLLQQEHELLRRRVFEAKAERVDSKQLELDLEKTKAELDAVREQIEHATGTKLDDEAPEPKTRKRPAGRRRLEPATLPTEEIVVTDPEMEALVAQGLAEVVGSDDSTRMKRRRACTVCLIIKRLTYRMTKAEGSSETTLVTSAAPAEIIARSIGTPSLYANIIVEKHDRAMPLYRQEERFEHEGVPLDRGTMSRWMNTLGGTLGATVLHAMKEEAMRTALCLSTDATQILVQRGRDPTTNERRACKKGHYFVQIADRDAVFFEYVERETSAAVMELFRGFEGYIQADAKNVYDILFREPDAPPDPDIAPDGKVRKEAGCWAHARRYFWEAAAVAKEPVAREALYRIRRVFETDARFWERVAPSKRKGLRVQFLKPEVEAFFVFAHAELAKVQGQRGLLRSALVYATNQEAALRRVLEEPHLKLDNNASERALRKVAIGRKNWLFVGSDDHAQTTANLLSIVASAKLHDLDPEGYVRDLLRVLPQWPRDRYLELAPKYWLSTHARLDHAQLNDELGPLTIPSPRAR